MGTFSLVGSDTIKINLRLLADLPHGEVAKVTYTTDLVTVKTGKNGNTIFAQNASGFQATMELKLIRGSADDKFMNTELTSYRGNATGYVLIGAEIVKRIGDGLGVIGSDTYLLKGGVVSKQVEVTSNVEGDVEQALSVYSIQFAACDRVIS